MTKKPYGYIYDKAGNLKEVSAPVRAIEGIPGYLSIISNDVTGVNPSKPHKTVTGKIPDSVGFAGFGK